MHGICFKSDGGFLHAEGGEGNSGPSQARAVEEGMLLESGDQQGDQDASSWRSSVRCTRRATISFILAHQLSV